MFDAYINLTSILQCRECLLLVSSGSTFKVVKYLNYTNLSWACFFVFPLDSRIARNQLALHARCLSPLLCFAFNWNFYLFYLLVLLLVSLRLLASAHVLVFTKLYFHVQPLGFVCWVLQLLCSSWSFTVLLDLVASSGAPSVIRCTQGPGAAERPLFQFSLSPTAHSATALQSL